MQTGKTLFWWAGLVLVGVVLVGLGAYQRKAPAKSKNSAVVDELVAQYSTPQATLEEKSRCADYGWKAWEHYKSYQREAHNLAHEGSSWSIDFPPQFGYTNGKCLMFASNVDGFGKRLNWDLIDVYSNQILNFGTEEKEDCDYQKFITLSRSIIGANIIVRGDDPFTRK